MGSVFISYKRQDVEFARRLGQRLASWGHDTWLDVDQIAPGASWDDSIHGGLKGADAVLGILTPESLASENVRDEWGYALSTGKRLILLWIRPVAEEDIPPRYIRQQRIDLINPEAQNAGWERLRRALEEPPKASSRARRSTMSQLQWRSSSSLPRFTRAPREVAHTRPIIGIDFGTTNSVVAVIEGGEAITIPDARGSHSTPSAVGFQPDGSVVVGQQALQMALLHPERVVLEVKRLFGKDLVMEWQGKSYTAPIIASFILEVLLQSATTYLGETVGRAILTVPAYFTEAHLRDTRIAAEMAGLHVVRILREPVAAALTYQSSLLDSESEVVLVYDLGGGTFDVSVLEISNGVYEVKAVYGDNELGGLDFDMALVQYCLLRFQQATGIDLSNDAVTRMRFRDACERAKVNLTSTREATIDVPYLCPRPPHLGGGHYHLAEPLSRDLLHQIIGSLIERTIDCCRVATRDARIDLKDLDRLVLIGMATRTPGVREALEAWAGKKPAGGVDPDRAVALGAAIQGGIFSGAVKYVVLLDIIPRNISVETLGDRATLLIERNTTIPTRKSQTLTTIVEEQTYAVLRFLEGNSSVPSQNRCLRQIVFGPLPDAPRGVPQVEVTLDCHSDGLLIVTLREKSTGLSREERLDVPGWEEVPRGGIGGFLTKVDVAPL